MKLHGESDLDLERRLRRLAAEPQPKVPASLRQQANRIAGGDFGRNLNGVTVVPLASRGRALSGWRRLSAMTGVAAVLVVAVVAAGLLLGQRGPNPSPAWTPRPDAGTGEWTGLEWHDITATAGGMFTETPWWLDSVSSGGIVRWRGGFATMSGDLRLWISRDGLTWSRAAGAPMAFPVSLNGQLLACGLSYDGTRTACWRSDDAVTWQQVATPFDASRAGLVQSGGRVVAAVATGTDTTGNSPHDLWVSSDGVTWVRATLPTDLASALNLYLVPSAFGFLAQGQVHDPDGNIISYDAGKLLGRYSARAWISRDGLTWATYAPSTPSGTRLFEYPIQYGRLGATTGELYSTDGGSTWLQETATLAGLGGAQPASDGSRIVLAAGGGSEFYVGLGDGRWQKLAMGGDAGSLPAPGHMMLLPNGVLWFAGARVYFGQGLSGVAPRGTLGPLTRPSPTDAFTAAPVAEITPTPVWSVRPTLIPTGFDAAGARSDWKGFTWSAAPSGGMPDRILPWRGGYVGVKGVSRLGWTAPGDGVWVSSDGERWTPATGIGDQQVVVSVAPAGLIAIGFNAPGPDMPLVAGSVWASSDGIAWRNAGPANLPGELVSIAGTDQGIVAVFVGMGEDKSITHLIEYSKDGLQWTPETLAPGVEAAPTGYPPPHLQTNGGRFYLMGSYLNPVTSGSGFVLAGTRLYDQMWLSDDGRSWTPSQGGYGDYADYIDFGRDGMVLHTNAMATAGATGLAYSTDGGLTWHDSQDFSPLGPDPCAGACATGPDGVVASNGTVIVAVQWGGQKAWLSYDGHTWTPVPWGADLEYGIASYGGDGFTVLPRGVVVGGQYGAAR
jgi:hypothetical protein